MDRVKSGPAAGVVAWLGQQCTAQSSVNPLPLRQGHCHLATMSSNKRRAVSQRAAIFVLRVHLYASHKLYFMHGVTVLQRR